MSKASQAPTLEELNKIRAFLDSHPDMFKTITGKGLGGRKKAVKNRPLEDGDVVEVSEPKQQVIEASPEEIKQVIKKTRKPRQLTEEAKEKMKEVLAKGREALRLKREAEKAAKEVQAPQPKIIKKSKVPEGYEGEVVVKKYIVKRPQSAPPKKINGPKATVQQIDSEDEDTFEDDFTTESESDTTLMKKIKRKGKVLKKLDTMLQKPPQQETPTYHRGIFRR
jgi:hypothetical protein